MERLTAIQMVEQLKNHGDPIKTAKDMDLFINSYSIPEKEFLLAIKMQKPKVRKLWNNICLLWILKLSSFYYKGYYDDRNKKSCEVARDIEYNYRSEFPDKNECEFENQFVEQLSSTHRTLQQNFSRIVFKWFIMMAEDGKRPYKALVKRMPEKFNYLPCI